MVRIINNMYWYDNLNTGNDLIDEEQSKFISIIKDYKLNFSCNKEKANQEVGSVIVFLVKYITKYFPLEEAYLKSIEFKDLDAHIKAHREFSTKVFEVLNILKSKKSFRPFQLYYLLNEWLEEHILERDRNFLKKEEQSKKKVVIKSAKEIISMVEREFQIVENQFLKEIINNKVREDKRILHLRNVYDSIDIEHEEVRPVVIESITLLFDRGLIIDREYKGLNSYISH